MLRDHHGALAWFVSFVDTFFATLENKSFGFKRIGQALARKRMSLIELFSNMPF
jgi:hypothetical protein